MPSAWVIGRQVEAHGLRPAHGDANNAADDQDRQPRRQRCGHGLVWHGLRSPESGNARRPRFRAGIARRSLAISIGRKASGHGAARGAASGASANRARTRSRTAFSAGASRSPSTRSRCSCARLHAGFAWANVRRPCVGQVQAACAPIAPIRHKHDKGLLEQRLEVACQRGRIHHHPGRQGADANTIERRDMPQQAVLRNGQAARLQRAVIDLRYPPRSLAQAKTGAADRFGLSEFAVGARITAI